MASVKNVPSVAIQIATNQGETSSTNHSRPATGAVPLNHAAFRFMAMRPTTVRPITMGPTGPLMRTLPASAVQNRNPRPHSRLSGSFNQTRARAPCAIMIIAKSAASVFASRASTPTMIASATKPAANSAPAGPMNARASQKVARTLIIEAMTEGSR